MLKVRDALLFNDNFENSHIKIETRVIDHYFLFNIGTNVI